MSIDDLKRVAKRATDENGETVIQITLEDWERYTLNSAPEVEAESKPYDPATSQAAQILAVIESFDEEDMMPDEWWDEFNQFLKDNRFNIPERDLDWGIEE